MTYYDLLAQEIERRILNNRRQVFNPVQSAFFRSPTDMNTNPTSTHSNIAVSSTDRVTRTFPEAPTVFGFGALQNATQAVEDTLSTPSAPVTVAAVVNDEDPETIVALDRILQTTYAMNPDGVKQVIEDVKLINEQLLLKFCHKPDEVLVLCRPNERPQNFLRSLLTYMRPVSVSPEDWARTRTLCRSLELTETRYCRPDTRRGFYRLKYTDLTKTLQVPNAKFFTSLGMTQDSETVFESNPARVGAQELLEYLTIPGKLYSAILQVLAQLDANSLAISCRAQAVDVVVDNSTTPVEYNLSMNVHGAKITFTKIPITQANTSTEQNDAVYLLRELQNCFIILKHLMYLIHAAIANSRNAVGDNLLYPQHAIYNIFASQRRQIDLWYVKVRAIADSCTALAQRWSESTEPVYPPVYNKHIPNSEAQYLTADRVRDTLKQFTRPTFSSDGGYVSIYPTPRTLQPSEDLFNELHEYLNSFGVQVQLLDVCQSAIITRGAFDRAEYKMVENNRLRIYRTLDFDIEFMNTALPEDHGFTQIERESPKAVMYAGPGICVHFTAYGVEIRAYCVRRAEFIEAVNKLCTNKAAMQGIRDLPDTEFVYLANSKWCERNSSGGVQSEGMDYHSPLVTQKTLREWILNSMGVRLALEGNAQANKFVTIGASTESKTKSIDEYFKALETLNQSLQSAGPSEYEVVRRSDSTTPVSAQGPVTIPVPSVPAPVADTVQFTPIEEELLRAFVTNVEFEEDSSDENDSEVDEYDPFGDD